MAADQHNSIQNFNLGADIPIKPEDGTLNDRMQTNTYKSPIIPVKSEDLSENYNEA